MMNKITHDNCIAIIRKTRKYVQNAHNKAESLHENYGEYYMDNGQYEIMEETEKLLNQIDLALGEDV